MTVLFAGGENSELDVLNGVTITDPTYFRATYARCAVRSYGANGILHTYSGELAAYIAAQGTAVDFWYGFQYYGAGGFTTDGVCVVFSGTAAQPFLRVWNASGTATGTCQLSLSTNGSTWTEYPFSNIAQPVGTTPAEWTFRIKRDATVGKFQWWIDRVLWYEVTGNTTGYFSTATRTAWWVPGSNITTAVSEVVATSSDDPRVGMNCATLSYTGNGAQTGWTGTYTDINENAEDTATVLTAASANLESCFTHTSLPALSAGVIVRAVIPSGKWRTAATFPQNLANYLRIAGTNYANAPLPAAIQAVSSVASLLQSIWHLSPATGLAFTEAEVNALQPGMKSVT